MKRLKSISLIVAALCGLNLMQSCKVLYPNQMLKTDSGYNLDDVEENQPE